MYGLSIVVKRQLALAKKPAVNSIIDLLAHYSEQEILKIVNQALRQRRVLFVFSSLRSAFRDPTQEQKDSEQLLRVLQELTAQYMIKPSHRGNAE